MNAGFLKLTASRVASVCAMVVSSIAAVAQLPARIAGPVVNSNRVTIAGTHRPVASAANDAGAVPDTAALQGMTLVLSRSATQQAALDALVAAQQNPASPEYRQWLTPEQFAAQFGAASSDLNAVSTWLGQEGFQGMSVARSRDRISFSGNAKQFAAAFGTPLHYFNVNGAKHFAPAGDVSVPAAIAPVVLSVQNVTDFRPKPAIVRPKSAFTSSQTGSHYLTPGDVSTIYDVNPAYNAGYTGAGVSIAVIGQSAVLASDITNFQSAAGVPVRAPQLILVPNTGLSTLYEGDESESDLDLEYSSALGKGATVYFVYAGSSANADVFTALTYAVTNNIAQIVTLSYGACEATLSQGDYNSINATLEQAATQGQTVVNSSGDSGSTACYGDDGTTSAQQTALSVSFPASSQYAAGIGGTEFPTADIAIGNNTYFQAETTADIINSALGYIPETVWNDDSTSNGVSAGTGGVSTFTPRPTWQTGVPGIAAGTYRLVPDISLTSSAVNAPYLYCSSDPSSGITGSCSNGFRDASNVYLTVAGGTSFATPTFAGMLSLIEQRLGGTGLGLINPTLYSLAANSNTYATAFHDITTGTNGCAAGTSYPIGENANGTIIDGPQCTSADVSYPAGVGYDEATGLGSIDLYNLLTAWPATSSLAGSRVSLSPATTALSANNNDVVTITVTPASGSGVPTGTVAISVDGSLVTTPTLVNGSTTYTFSTPSSGNHVILASYSGNSIYEPSRSSLTLTVSGVGGFTLSAPAITIATGNSGNENITLTPTGGYQGSVGFTVTTSSSIANTCYGISSAAVTGTSPATVQLQVYTSSAICGGSTPLLKGGGKVAALGKKSPPAPGSPAPIGISLAGLLAVGLLGRRSRALRGMVLAATLAVAGFGLSGCSGGDSAATGIQTGNAPTSTYTVTVTATDAVTPSISASTTFTLTLQ